MTEARQYGFDEVEASWTVPIPPPGQAPGLDIKRGCADGSSIVEARTAPRYAMREDGMGNVLFTFNPGKSGTLTITVVQESRLHQKLSERMIADEVLHNQVGPILVTDNASGESYVFTNARIMTEPNMVRGKEPVTFEWVFGYARRDHVVAGGDDNLVGG